MSRKFIPISQPSIGKDEIRNVTRAVRSGWVSSIGEYISIFENEFATYCGVKHALAVSNGTVAIHLALVALGIGPGDEVIVPDLTFVATANAVKHAGATPVFADIEPASLCIDPVSAEKLISIRTKAIIPVHLYGHPANMAAINALADKHNLFVIEDAAEAHGAEIDGKKVGSFGHCSTFSFYGNKIITTGEGGIITTNNDALYDHLRLLRDHAMLPVKRYWHTEVGFNFRITNLQAALGVAQLRRIDELLSRRELIFSWYEKHLSPLLKKGNVKLNHRTAGLKNVYWMICLTAESLNESSRDTLMLELKKLSIDSRPFFYPVSDMPMYERADTPVSYSVYSKGLNLPSAVQLTENQVQYICKSVMQIFKKLNL